MSTETPIRSVTRRSFVRRSLDALGASWGEAAGDCVAALSIPGQHPAAAVVLRDFSPLVRTGFKGAETPAWLDARGVACPAVHNQAVVLSDGTLVARLSPGEFLLLAGPGGESATVASLNADWSIDNAGLCFQVPRRDSHAWFRLSGAKTPEMFAKLCAVDLRPHKFADLAIAQTSLARLSAIIIRDDRAGTEPAFHVLADSASAVYLWDVLTDAMAEYGGAVGGLR